MTIQDDFKAEIEAFLTRHDMKPAAFGAQSLHDPKFVFDLRAGRSPSLKTIEKVRTWMAERDAAAGKQPESMATEVQPAPASESAQADADEKTETPPAASRAGQTGETPSAPARSHGLRNAILVILAILVIAVGALLVWKPAAVRSVASGLYLRMAGDQGRGAATSDAAEQFSAVVGAVQEDFNDLRRRLDQMEGRLEDLEGRPVEGGGGPAIESGRLEELEERIAALENRPAPEAGAPSGPAPALTRRLDDMERRLSEQENAPAVQPRDLESLRAQLNRLQQSTDRLRNRQDELAALGEEVAGLREELDAVNTGVSDISGLQAGIERSAAISAFMRLDADVRSGQPYQASLTLYQRQLDLQDSGEDWPSGQSLTAEAATGIATQDALEARLEAIIPEIIAGAEEGDSWTERLWSRLSGIVVVRRTGEQEGDTPEAIVARAERRLASGDLEGAISEMESLPEGRQAVAADWLADARTRLDTLNTLSDMATALSSAERS